MAGHGAKPVIIAVINNSIITVLKFIGFLISGSGSMFSEAIHSFADAANQALLLIGIKRSQKKATKEFHYGYSQERFFWALVSACGIFFVGAGVTIYHGIHALIAGEHANISKWVFIILAISFVLEGISLKAALDELRANHKGLSLRECVKKGNPTTVAVLLEDGIALMGVILAIIGITLSHITGQYYWDAIFSIIIGLSLAYIAIFLISMNRKYLIEIAMPIELESKLTSYLDGLPEVTKIIYLKTSTLGVDEYRVRCEIDFDSSKIECNTDADEIAELIGKRVDEIKVEIQKEIPSIKYFNIEIC